MTLTPRERATLAAICRAIVPATDLPLVDLIDDGLTDSPEHLRARTGAGSGVDPPLPSHRDLARRRLQCARPSLG